MSGIKYLLDTNFVLGMLKSSPGVLEVLASKKLTSQHCAYSAITRMELLGFPGMTPAEEHLIRSTLDQFRYLAITGDVEDAAITIRRIRRAKLPDALIAATALCHSLELLTLDAEPLKILGVASHEREVVCSAVAASKLSIAGSGRPAEAIRRPHRQAVCVSTGSSRPTK